MAVDGGDRASQLLGDLADRRRVLDLLDPSVQVRQDLRPFRVPARLSPHHQPVILEIPDTSRSRVSFIE